MRVGEARNPGPASKRRRTQRLRALQRSLDSDSEDDMPLVSTGPEVFAMSSDIGDTVVDEPTPQDVLDALEQDLCQIEGDQPIVARADAENDLLEPAPFEVVPKEDQSDTESVHTQPQRRRLILNFARDREGDSNGEVEMEHQERNDVVEEPDDVLYVPHARASTPSSPVWTKLIWRRCSKSELV